MKVKSQLGQRSPSAIYQRERGFVLMNSLILLAILSFIGATAVLNSITDRQIATNVENSSLALYNAEAGVHYTLSMIGDLLADGSLLLTGLLDTETLAVPIVAPAGFSFDPIDTFTRLESSKNYRFRSTGRTGTSSVTLNVVIRIGDKSAVFGLFGNQMIDLQGNAQIFSYDSTATPNPTPAEATGKGELGSNEEMRLYNSVYIDGHVMLGADALGNQGNYSVIGGGDPSVTGGWPPVNIARVNPDPLDSLNGDLGDAIKQFSKKNDNQKKAKPPIPASANDIVNLSAGDSLTLQSGNYHFNSITLNAGSTLNIDTSKGPVNIYLEGEFNALQDSSLTYNSATGSPLDFTIYSNASAPITLGHLGAFKGMIYAPYSSVEINNRAGSSSAPLAYGLIWGNSVTLHESGQFYFDTTLQVKSAEKIVSVVSWKEVKKNLSVGQEH